MSRINAETEQTKRRKSLVERVKGINRLCACTVILPTAIATAYYGFIASDVYVSESRFVVRSADKQAQTGVVGALLQGTTFSHSQDNAYPVIDYIQSRDALRVLNRDDYIEREYGDHGDFASRFLKHLDGSFEALWKYYTSHIVNVEFDGVSSITTLKVRAFNPDDAQRINEELLRQSEQLINQMNVRAARDTVRFSEDRVAIAAKAAKDAAAALAAFRNSRSVFDPDKQSALQLQQIASLQEELLESQTRLIQLQKIAPENPQVNALKTNVATLKEQIDRVTNGVAGSASSLSAKAAMYARMQLDVEFTGKELASAMAALESSRAEAQRQQLYLERVVQPSKPDSALEPRRLRAIAATFVVGLVVWGVLTIFLAGVREHKD